ncbi:MAG: BrnA antitoxin family protein [Phycisphaerales bacterium]
MRREYDFAIPEGRKNPHAKRLTKQVTLCLGVDVIEYFKALADETGIPYQSLINLHLRECARTGKRLDLSSALLLHRGISMMAARASEGIERGIQQTGESRH